MTSTKARKPGGPAGKGLKVIPKRAPFRRAGHAFEADGKTIPYEELDEDQVALLKGEPNLVLIEVDVPKDDTVAENGNANKKK